MAPYERRPSWSRTTSVPGTTRNHPSHGRPARHCRGGAFGVSGQQRDGRQGGRRAGEHRQRRQDRRQRRPGAGGRRGQREGRAGRRRTGSGTTSLGLASDSLNLLPGRRGPRLRLAVVHGGRRGTAAPGTGRAARPPAAAWSASPARPPLSPRSRPLGSVTCCHPPAGSSRRPASRCRWGWQGSASVRDMTATAAAGRPAARAPRAPPSARGAATSVRGAAGGGSHGAGIGSPRAPPDRTRTSIRAKDRRLGQFMTN